MRALLVTLLFGLAGAASLILSTASADMVKRAPFAEKELRSRVAKLRTSAGSDPDTVWIGHVNTVTGAPGTPGGYGPHHIGRGPNNIVGGLLGTAANYNGVWSFDHFNNGETDSLMGWWPIQAPFGSVGPTNFDDFARPWFGLDYGNQGNYTIQQGAANKRTFGVTGYWHADGGSGQPAVAANPGDHNPVSPSWTPIAGSKSAWCGLRSHGDVAVMDPITGNGYNSTVLSFQGNNSGAQISSQRTEGTDHNFPGYGSQWDQILYRDVTLPANLGGGQNLTIQFKYTTNMSTLFDGNHASQTGWFDKDPLTVTNNFISTTATGGVVDSFMVYIGAPVNDAAVTFSDGTVGAVYDPQRRWFSEVVRINSPGTSYRQVLSAAGVNGTPGVPITFGPVDFGQTIVNPILDLDGGAGNGGRVRLVFRIKTNRGADDENNGNSGFSSGTVGAAIIDDVVVTGPSGTLLNNGFEGAGDIDNNNGVAATAAWKSTGKPPGAWFHVHDIDEVGNALPYEDPCGAISASVRFCNMGNAVLSPGNHDLQDKTGGVYGSTTQDQQKYVVSPTINLRSNGAGDYNGMGIDAEIASRVQMLYGDQLFNIYNYPLTGNGFRYGWQSYPSTQPNGVRTWGEMRKTIFFNFVENRGCFEGIIGLPGDDQLLVTTNANGVPDSIRAYIESMSRCFATPLTAQQCSPATGVNAGGYYDNLSIGFVTAPPPPQLAANIWDLLQDQFPVNGTGKAVDAFGVAYDTLAAHMRSGYNRAPQRKNDLTGPDARENVPGDTAYVGANGDNVRVDLVFRILPGVGNYVSIGNRASGVARRPDTVPRVAAAPADAGNGALSPVDKFWGAYMADNGAYGTGGNGTTGPGHPGGWDPNKWNSARMDTVEINFFPIDGVYSNGAVAQLAPSFYMTAYHESDPKYSVLGIPKNRCFLNKNGGIPLPKLNQDQINCGVTVAFPTYPPTFYTDADPSDGYNPAEIVGQPGKTYEFTKILPDGQFTPGAHIQYFFRKSEIGNVVNFDMVPDTNFIFPQTGEGGYFDLHRWREVSVLPDRWKDPAFGTGGTGMACMLVLDLGDRRGDEAIWVAVADSMGLTQANRRGAHNGWRARPDQNIFGVNVGGDDTIARRDNGGQPGSVWDLFETVAGESNVPSGRPGSRGAATNGGLTDGKRSTAGPSEGMVNNYKVLVLLSSDLGRESIGPVPNQTDNDIGMYASFLSVTGGSGLPRGLIMQGFRIGEALTAGTAQSNFLSTNMRATLRDEDYRAMSGNTADVADLIVNAPVAPVGGFTYGVYNPCFIGNDVFNTSTAAVAGAHYEAVGGGAPYVASVFTPVATGHPSLTLINGWTLGLFGGMGTENTLLNVGTRKYVYDLLTNAFGTLACQPSGPPVGVGDQGGPGSAFMNFMNLKSSNPMRSGEARIAFGLAKTEKVQVQVYDVTGRLVKKVADRTFQGGMENVVIWDGTNEVGERVKSGVYFYQLKTPTWTSQKKLAVLAN